MQKHDILPKVWRVACLGQFSIWLLKSGQRLCEHFQKKFLHRILSDKHWLMEKFQRTCIYLSEQLKVFNLGSQFYFQNDSMTKTKQRSGVCMKSQAFSYICSINATEKVQTSLESRKKICDKKGFIFQFTELCTQRIESQWPFPNNGDYQRIIMQTKNKLNVSEILWLPTFKNIMTCIYNQI